MQTKTCSQCKYWASKNRDKDAYAPCTAGIGRMAFNDFCKAFEPIQVTKGGGIGYHPNVRDYSGDRG